MEMNSTTPGVRLCHKLTKYHVWLTPYAKMKVNLAAQVSLMVLASTMHVCYRYSVRQFLQILTKDDTVETRLFI